MKLRGRYRRARGNTGLFDELAVDLFAGGGGASLGIERALGRAIDLAINHDRAAVEMHARNHPHTRHLCEDVFDVDPVAATGGRRVGLLWASPDCKHFSKAKGGKPVSRRIRGLAWIVIRWAKAVRPRVIFLENVEEFQTWGPLTAENLPDPQRRGLTFRRWVGMLRNLGYAVEWRELRACDYGVPTTRKRLYLVARCDGRPIAWPERTHGRGLRPYRTAAECIDWTLPCPSIFERKRPLAEKTCRRIAAGVMRYVVDAAEPFIVRIGQTGSRGKHVNAASEPLTTVTTKAEHCLVSAFIAKNYGGVVGTPTDAPVGTVTANDHHSLVSAFFVPRYGERAGQTPRASRADQPAPTVTPKANGASLVAANLVHFNHGAKQWNSAAEPLNTVMASGNHAALVYSFLCKYFGNERDGAPVNEPMHTVTSKDRFGLVTVTVEGEEYVIVDIGLRMLTPRELARAQGFPDEYVLTGTKSSQVARIGNSVCPAMAEAIVRSNVRAAEAEGVA